MKKLIVILGTGMLTIYGCREPVKDPGVNFEASVARAIDSGSSSCPYVTTTPSGQLVVSYVKQLTDSTAVVCYALSANQGHSFGRLVQIPASSNVNPHAENMPKLLFKPSGEIIAAWGAANPDPRNAYAGLVYYAQSFDDGNSWTPAIPLVKDTGSYDQRYFDLALLADGEAAITWLDNRKPDKLTGSAIYFARTHKREGFGREQLIGESCCECCRTDLLVDSKNRIHVAYRGIINDSIRDMIHIVSDDGGKSFSKPQRLSNDNWVINGCPHTGPSMLENKTGLHVAWYTLGNGSGLYFTSSSNNGRSFSARDSIRCKPAARHPQMMPFGNGDMLIVWDEAMQKGNEAFTAIGLQKRDAAGKLLYTRYMAEDTTRLGYPVGRIFPNNKAFIAYTVSSQDSNRVFYRQVVL